jgi:hypothetical protein
MKTPVAVVIAAIIIAATMAVIFRYQIDPVSVGVAYKYDLGRVSCSNAPSKKAG